MVQVVVNVSKIIIAAGVAAGIVILAAKADAEGAKTVLTTAAGSRRGNSTAIRHLPDCFPASP